MKRQCLLSPELCITCLQHALAFIGALAPLLQTSSMYNHLGQYAQSDVLQAKQSKPRGPATLSSTCRAYAIRDYYPFWKSRNERSRAGKLLLLDRANEDVIQIFFDDNIGHGSANIVDVRDVMSGEPLAFQVTSHQLTVCFMPVYC